MAQNDTWKEFKPGTKSKYRIRVQGHLDESWTDRMGGMVITRAFTAHKCPVTILVGDLADQAALAGVLNTFFDMRLMLLSVENLDEPD